MNAERIQVIPTEMAATDAQYIAAIARYYEFQSGVACEEHYARLMKISDRLAAVETNAQGLGYEPLGEMFAALTRIWKLDPTTDSEEVFYESGEADCFQQARAIAAFAIKQHGSQS